MEQLTAHLGVPGGNWATARPSTERKAMTDVKNRIVGRYVSSHSQRPKTGSKQNLEMFETKDGGGR